MMWEACARISASSAAARLLMGRNLSAARYDAGKKIWTIEVLKSDGTIENFTARHVVSSAPLSELVAKISPKPISLLHARQLRYRDFLTVALMVKKPDLFPDNWIYIHDPSRESWPRAEFPFVVAGNGAGRDELPWS